MSKHTKLIARLEAAEVGSKDLDNDILSFLWESADEGLKTKIVSVPYGLTTSVDAPLALASALFGSKVALSILADAAMECFELILDVRDLPLSMCAAILHALDAQDQK